ncbi:MAG: hypothetical protein A3E38_01550 [Candidatus Moranbacteria bacterium RIFCSPHIGHO2_12_FULL_54_9]|nr:MAG: hypothetical protein A2878_02600 [Candidatus Moranbacteria bacterium RIFCSPHIGHO2_01_FULL_54_31]OGI25712.1 MAG: hypothetical protein A3E38_01550 [Candidatus Moranbacteria bacterium RIFCSPHIGHO2_12_FULL_54_9]
MVSEEGHLAALEQGVAAEEVRNRVAALVGILVVEQGRAALNFKAGIMLQHMAAAAAADITAAEKGATVADKANKLAAAAVPVILMVLPTEQILRVLAQHLPTQVMQIMLQG